MPRRKEGRHVTPRALMVLPSWAVQAALATDARQCWQQCPQEIWKQGLQSLHGRGRGAGLPGTVCWPCREPGLAAGQEGWSCCWDTGVQPSKSPCSGTAGTLSLGTLQTPLILGTFARLRPLLMPQTRGPARGELITTVMSLVLDEESQEVFLVSKSLWSCCEPLAA